MIDIGVPYFTDESMEKVITFDYDEFPISPREWSPTTFVTWIRSYSSPNRNDYDDPNELWEELNNGNYYFSKVYAQIHSGIYYYRPGMNIGEDSWDCGFAGFIFISKEDAEKISIMDITGAINLFDEELDQYNCYMSGDCYKYTIETPDGDELEYSDGYYDLDHCVSCAEDDCEIDSKKFIKARKEMSYKYVPK